MDAVATDFWGVVVPSWIGAVGGLVSAIVGAVALISSIRNRRGLATLRAGANSAQAAPHSMNRTLLATADLVRWELVRERRGRWLLRNASPSASVTLTGFADVTPDRTSAATLLVPVPVELGPGASVPFRVERAIAGSSISAIRVKWDEAGERREQTLYA